MSKYDINHIRFRSDDDLTDRAGRLERLLASNPRIGNGIRQSWRDELARVERELRRRKNGGSQ